MYIYIYIVICRYIGTCTHDAAASHTRTGTDHASDTLFVPNRHSTSPSITFTHAPTMLFHYIHMRASSTYRTRYSVTNRHTTPQSITYIVYAVSTIATHTMPSSCIHRHTSTTHSNGRDPPTQFTTVACRKHSGITVPHRE